MPYLLTHRGLTGYRGLGATIQDQITSAASQYGVPPSVALAVAQRESGFNQGAVGSSGEIGVFQLMPGTAAQLGVNPSDLTQNIQGGLKYLSQMYSQFGNWTQALEAYNGGPGNVQRGTVSSAAQSYASDVLSAAGISDSSSAGSSSPAPGDFTGGASAPAGYDPGMPVPDSSSGLDFSNPLVWGGIGIAVLAVAWAATS